MFICRCEANVKLFAREQQNVAKTNKQLMKKKCEKFKQPLASETVNSVRTKKVFYLLV
jgi:hypothetical protein